MHIGLTSAKSPNRGTELIVRRPGRKHDSIDIGWDVTEPNTFIATQAIEDRAGSSGGWVARVGGLGPPWSLNTNSTMPTMVDMQQKQPGR